MAAINPSAAALLAHFPPTIGPSVRQQWLTLIGGIVSPTEYHTPTFSAEFEAIYGRPTGHYSAFKRLMEAPVSPGLAPRWRQNFLVVAKATSYLEFCLAIDQRTAHQQLPVLDRRAMEGLWVQKLVQKYDELKPAELAAPVLSGEVTTEEEALVHKQKLLHKAIKKIYHVRDVENYWVAKPAKYGVPGLDIRMMDDDADEPAADLSLEVPDDADEEDETISDVETMEGDLGDLVEDMDAMDMLDMSTRDLLGLMMNNRST